MIAKQLRAKDINCCIVGADGWDGVLGNAGEEVLNGFYSNHYAADSTEPAVQKFVSAFNEKYEKDPNAFAALGYDSVYLLKDAISKAGTADATAVKAALEATILFVFLKLVLIMLYSDFTLQEAATRQDSLYFMDTFWLTERQ